MNTKIPFTTANNWFDHPEIQEDIPWCTGPGTGGICFVADRDKHRWEVRLNDFPVEPLYTLLIDGFEVLHFDEWPNFWHRPQLPEMRWKE